MTAMIDPGLMRHKVELHRKGLGAADSYGMPAETDLTYAEPWARIECFTGRELDEGGQTRGEVTHTVTIRYREGVLPSDWVVWGTRTLQIVAVKDAEGTREILTLECKENVSGGS